MSEMFRSAVTGADPHRYDDILMLPHHVSAMRPRMPMSERAAQFSPFAALTGYDDAVAETGRRDISEKLAAEHGEPFYESP